ncbi:MAG: 5-(carboxyamino)imidazole ribonucleotide mutase [Chloroflexota bacterium]|nr:5-(carboxyamino)imidazole ribonucleotide mutase [Chloroflexota bacterium]
MVDVTREVRVAIVVGSRSDVATLEKAVALLDEFEIGNELRVISAHRAPDLLAEYVAAAQDRGVEVFIAAAGLAAHLPGVIAAKTPLPVIGVPMPGNLMGGLDALLSIVQMPRGVPVATVGVGNAENAAILAAEILGLKDQDVRDRVVAYRAAQTQAIVDDPSNREDFG